MADEQDAYRLQYDEQGRPYYQYPGQPRNYVSPAAFGKPIGGNPESAWHSAPQWNQHTGEAENPFKWGKAITAGTAGALALGGLNAAGVIGGGGAGSVAGDVAGVAGKIGGMGAGGWAPEVAGGVAGGIGQKLLKSLTSGQGIASLASLIPLLLAIRGGGGGSNGGAGAGDFAQMPQLNSLLDMSVNRAQRTDPLHQAVTQLAMARLPTNVQR